jgi:hypothetical protein
MTGGLIVSDVTLQGTARRVAGSDDETGTAVLKALASGEARIDLSFPSGTRSEVRANSDTGPVGSWLGADSTKHPISNHNLMADSGWFFPVFTVAKTFGQEYAVSLIGQETRNSQSVIHIRVSQQFSGLRAGSAALLQRLSQFEIFLDSSTLLPVALAFSVHPDDDAALDIPAEVRFSNYRAVNGIEAPFRVQKFLNNGLVLDLQFQTLTLNAGLSAATFSVP